MLVPHGEIFKRLFPNRSNFRTHRKLLTWVRLEDPKTVHKVNLDLILLSEPVPALPNKVVILSNMHVKLSAPNSIQEQKYITWNYLANKEEHRFELCNYHVTMYWNLIGVSASKRKKKQLVHRAGLCREWSTHIKWCPNGCSCQTKNQFLHIKFLPVPASIGIEVFLWYLLQ